MLLPTWMTSSLAHLPLTAAFTFAIAAAATLIGFAIERSPYGRRRVIFDLPLAPGQLRWELLASLRFCAMATVAFALVLGTGALGTTEETWRAGVYSFAVQFVGFDVFYYFFHRALHHRRLMRFHRLHHKSRVTSPLTGFSLGWVESAGWIGCWVVLALLAALIAPVSIVGFTVYLVVLFVANILGHTSVDWFPRISGSRFMTWGNHPITFHALHHARYDGHFSFAITALDRIFGSEWNDWPSLFRRVIDGKPMRRLQERGEPRT